MDIKRKPRKPHKPKPKPKPEPESELRVKTKDLEIVVIHRLTCGVCMMILRQLTENDLIDCVKLVNIDTENWGVYREYLPSGSMSLPIIISLKTKKISLGYTTIDNLIKKLSV